MVAPLATGLFVDAKTTSAGQFYAYDAQSSAKSEQIVRGGVLDALMLIAAWAGACATHSPDIRPLPASIGAAPAHPVSPRELILNALSGLQCRVPCFEQATSTADPSGIVSHYSFLIG